MADRILRFCSAKLFGNESFVRWAEACQGLLGGEAELPEEVSFCHLRWCRHADCRMSVQRMGCAHFVVKNKITIRHGQNLPIKINELG